MLGRLGRLGRGFSKTIYSNQHIRAVAMYDEKVYTYDNYLADYDEMYRIYLNRRWITKAEVWPKAYIVEEAPGIHNSLSKQALPYLQQLLHVDQMGKMHEMNQISSQFVMSALFEEDFKPFLDQVCRKTVLNGDQVPLEQARSEESNRNKLIELFRVFHFGQEMSQLEAIIEKNYILSKEHKFHRWLVTKVYSY